MFNQLTYNVVIQRLKAFATGHFLINDFTHGTLANMVEQINESSYPLMHVTPNEVSYNVGERSFTLDIVFADLPRLIDDRENYEKEVVSDMIQLAEDLIAEIRNGSIIFGSDVTLGDGVRLTPFTGDFTHTIAGVQMSVTLTFPYNWNACDIPADWTTGGSGSGSPAPNVSTLVLKTNGTANVVQSILDLTDGTNITINDLGDGRVEINSTGGTASWGNIIGTLSNQIDLQNALDTKVEFVALQMPSPTNAAFQVSGSPVINDGGTLIVTANGTANDYIDGTGALQSFPAIPESIDDLNDVNTSTAVADDLLTFNATNWVPITPKDFAAKLELDNLGNVDEITPSNGDVLRYNNASTWINDSGLTTAESNIAQLQSDIANAVLDGDAAGGDLSGTFPNPSVHKVHGVDFQSGTPSDQDIWIFHSVNNRWQHQPLSAANIPSSIDASKIASGVISNAEFEFLNGVTSSIQTQIDSKVTANVAVVGATATKVTFDSKGLITSGTSIQATDLPSGIDALKIGGGLIDNTEFGYLNGATSNLQAQLNSKVQSNSAITPVTGATKLNYDAKGLITGSSTLTASDIPSGIDGTKISGTLSINQLPAIGDSQIQVADVPFSSTTATTLSSLQVTLNANGTTTYLVECCLMIRQNSAVASGARIGLNWSTATGGSVASWHGNYLIGTGTTFRGEQYLSAGNGSLFPANAPYIAQDATNTALLTCTIRAIMVVSGGTSASVNVNPIVAVATNGQAYLFNYRGSYIWAQKIT